MKNEAATKLIRMIPLAVLALSSTVWTGCSTAQVSYSPAAVQLNTPAAEVVAPLDAIHFADKYVKDHPGTDYMIGSGQSMMPVYKDHTVIVTKKLDMADLKAGMTVVFIGDSGFPVAHVLVKQTNEGWVAQGVNNAACDETRITRDNFIGMVVKAYEPTSSPMLALIEPVSTAPSNAVASN